MECVARKGLTQIQLTLGQDVEHKLTNSTRETNKRQNYRQFLYSFCGNEN
jgi:hypothetical protein